MNERSLPERPSLAQYKKQAKELAKQVKSGDADAITRIRSHHPRFLNLPQSEATQTKFVLADAQLVIAREHGFINWQRFSQEVEAKHLDALVRDGNPDAVFKLAERALLEGDEHKLEALLNDHKQVFLDHSPPPYGPEPGRLSPHYSTDVRKTIAGNHYFERWEEYAEFRSALRKQDSVVAQFEAAADAIVDGNAKRLETILRSNPDLIRMRSRRSHHSTLLHYVGANGIESFRQKTPRNIIEIASILLDAGAEVDAIADMYGGSTTLLLVATSVHPYLAGRQNELMQLLLDRGAEIDHPASGPNQQSAVRSCLANGRGEAAEFLARHGAKLNLESAAGIGRLDVVRQFFDTDGSLKSSATRQQLVSGFLYACGWGHKNVIEFLIKQGIDVNSMNEDGETGLHWAAIGPNVDSVKLLLKNGASVVVREKRFDGTPLGWSIYGWREQPANQREGYTKVVELLVEAGAPIEPRWLESIDDPRMRAALGLTSS